MLSVKVIKIALRAAGDDKENVSVNVVQISHKFIDGQDDLASIAAARHFIKAVKDYH